MFSKGVNMNFFGYEFLILVFVALSGIILISSSYEDIKIREISHWKWALLLLLGIGTVAVQIIFNPLSAAAYMSGRYSITNQVDTMDLQSMTIYFVAAIIIFAIEILFFKGIGGGDIKLMLALNVYLGAVPVLLGGKAFRSYLCFSVPYKFYSILSLRLFDWSGILFSLFAVMLFLLLPLCLSGILSIPETIIRNIKYKKIERINEENKLNGVKRKVKNIHKSVAFIPYICAGYIGFAAIMYFLNTNQLFVL